MRCVRSGCDACLLNVEWYGLEEDGDEDEDENENEDAEDEKKSKSHFSRFVAFVCEVGGRRVCAGRGK